MKQEHRDIIDRAQADGLKPMELASELLERDLIESALSIIRKQTAPFSKLSESGQQKVIDDLEYVVRGAVKTAVQIIAGKGTIAVPFTLKQITVDSGLKIVGAVEADTQHRHALVDASQSLCLLVLAPYAYGDAKDSIKPEKDQADLPLDTAGGASDVVDANISTYDLAHAHVISGGEISAKAIGLAASVKRKDAGDLILQLAENGVISAPDEDGHRTLVAEPAAKIEQKAAVEPVDDGLYADACALVIREARVSIGFLKSELAVEEETADALIQRMEAEGVVSEENDMGGRAVFN